MWRKIKSIFILKKIYNNVDYKRKLNIITYNKRIQQKLGVSLIDFRRFSGKYVIEEYGKMREYNSDNHKLMFEVI